MIDYNVKKGTKDDLRWAQKKIVEDKREIKNFRDPKDEWFFDPTMKKPED